MFLNGKSYLKNYDDSFLSPKFRSHPRARLREPPEASLDERDFMVLESVGADTKGKYMGKKLMSLFGDKKKDHDVHRWTPSIEGIPDHALGENVSYSTKTFKSTYHKYPNAKHLKLYVKRMEDLMAELKSFDLEKGNKKDFLKTLADYYHVGANAHLFEKVNNSVLMAQVNYLLGYAGVKPIAHGRLDYIAFGSNSEDFRKIFLKTIGQSP